MSISAGARRRARGYALQILYASDTNPDGEPTVLADLAASYEDLEPDSRQFADALVHAAQSRASEISDIIQAASRNWRIERMARVDRNVIRLATAELLTGDAPTKVVLNEAVELAKRFGTAEAAAFVNGIVDRIAQLVGQAES